VVNVSRMDSLSQLVLGSSVAVLAMGKRVPAWKAALWGGVCGTLPDLDALIDLGDAVSNMTYHRSWSHSLLLLTIVSPVIAKGIDKIHRSDGMHFWRWTLAVWLALFTHPLLDNFTIYGTQLLQPFTDHPYALSNLFIIDPLVTLPLIIGVIVAVSRGHNALRWNTAGVVMSTAYIAWSLIAQQIVWGVFRDDAKAKGLDATKLEQRTFVNPAPFNTLLWRVVTVHDDRYEEGFYSLLDRERKIDFDRFARNAKLIDETRSIPAAARMAWFSKGFFKMSERDGVIYLSDLRMGQEPNYVFNFSIAKREGDRLVPVVPENHGSRGGNLREGLAWLWKRMWGDPVKPPS
jgi:inner membrane protein